MTARVVFTAGFSRRYTGGVREFTIEARNLRGVIKEMDRLYPGLGHHLEEETTVAIDGADPRDRLFPADPPGLRGLLHPQARRRVAGVCDGVARESIVLLIGGDRPATRSMR